MRLNDDLQQDDLFKRDNIFGAARGGGGSLPYKEANGDVPLDGVAFSRLD